MKRKKKITTLLKYLFVLGFSLITWQLNAQVGTSVDMNASTNGTTVSTCNGVLHDSGGSPGTGYQNGENYTITICPDNPGDAITLDFITFNLNTTNTATPPANNIDRLAIYDGNSTSATSLGTYTGNQLQGLLVSCTSFNTSGCITLVFTSNSAGTGVFAASITCTTPCQRPVAVLSAPLDTTLKICTGESITFNGTPSYAAPGFNIQTYLWNFDDGTLDSTSGTVVTHQFNTIGEFMVDLFLFDNNNCASTNRVTVQVLVGTEPDFTGTAGDTSICLGETLCLDGAVVGTTWTGMPGNNLGGATYLPDNVGQCFTSTIDFNVFNPGQTLTNVNDLLSICVNMEHSYIGDLVASIYCPDGTQVILYQQGGGWNSLGEPIDISGPNDPPGVGYPYCWAPNATLGTWADCGNAGATPNLITLPSGIPTLAPGTYSSLNPLSDLVGCPLNGTWTLEFCDLWGADDGWVFDWSINFNPAIIPPVTSFTPVIGQNCDSTYWTPMNAAAAATITSTSGNCNQICIAPTAVGVYQYQYTAVDDFGCIYDTLITVTVTQPPVPDLGPDLVSCPGIPVQLDATIPNSGASCDLTLDFQDSFGDGWNGSILTLTINGVATDYTMNSGSNISYTVSLPAGATYEFSYSPGFFENEVTYQIIDCNGNTIFSDGPFPQVGVVFSGMNGLDIIYNWTPAGGLSDPVIADPLATVSSPTTYIVSVYENGHPMCAQTDTINITIDPAVFAGIDGSITICYNEPPDSLFQYITGNPNTNGSWVDPSGAPFSGLFVTSAYPGGGIFSYIIPGNAGCPADTAFVDVTVIPSGDPACCVQPPVTINNVMVIDETCNNYCDGTITINATSAVNFSIDGGDSFVPINNFTALCDSTYSIVVADSNGCVATTTIQVLGPPEILPDFSFGPQPATTFAPEIFFLNQSSGAVTYLWDFAGLGTSTQQNPSFIFPDEISGTYLVCLYAYNANNCMDSICYNIVISDEFVLYVPNAFTPNGDDHNDIFIAFGNDVDPEYFELMIYNRWGELLYTSTSLQDGWDGTYRGILSENGVYVWKINTRSLVTGEYHTRTGHVTVVR